MAEKESPDLEKLAVEVDAVAPGFGGLVRAVQAHEECVERVRQKLERACEGDNTGLVLQALGRELRRVVVIAKGPIDGLFVAVSGDVYARPEGAKRG